MRIMKVSFLCFLVFLVLQLCGVIDWSWWCVTTPAAVTFGAIGREVELEAALGKDLAGV